jgi:hypothetical protein
MKRTMLVLAVALLFVGLAVYSAGGSRRQQNALILGQDPTGSPDPHAQPKVDLVIALDTSGSMSGLINAARQKLWDIVNEVGRAQPTPRLRVALLTYGSGGTEEDGYVIVQSDLTTDLDTINGRLFQLDTSGGTEYVGRAVYRATRELSWDKDRGTLRQIYVAGNESADQDRAVPTAQALGLAAQAGIFVNAIYCGSDGDGDASSWRTVSQLGEGLYASIDQDHGTVAIQTPYDGKLNELSARLNSTYLGYGPRGAAAQANQAAQDANAQKAHTSTGAARALAKVSGVYRNDTWDLVDARKAGKKITEIPKAMRPAPLRELSDGELNAVIDQKDKERETIRQEVLALSAQRRTFLEAEMKKQGKSDNRSFDKAIKEAIRSQAAKKKITLN